VKDLETRFLDIYYHSKKEEGFVFCSLMVFRKQWEFGLDREMLTDGVGNPTRWGSYYLFADNLKKGESHRLTIGRRKK
jgi:hypothetical protein